MRSGVTLRVRVGHEKDSRDLMLYKVMELGTDGWGINDPHRDRNLTKEQDKERLEHYIHEGVSPSRLNVSTPE